MPTSTATATVAAYARLRHNGPQAGSSSAATTIHSGPRKPRPMNATAMPAPSAAPPSSGWRSASAKPYSATATPSVTKSSGDSTCARSQKPTLPTRSSTGSQRNARPFSSRLAYAVASSTSASARPTTIRAALWTCSGGENALIASAPPMYASGGRGTYGSAGERRHDVVVAVRHLGGDADRRRVLRLPRVVAGEPERHPRRAQQRETELLQRAIGARGTDRFRIDRFGNVGTWCAHAKSGKGSVDATHPERKRQPRLPFSRWRQTDQAVFGAVVPLAP